MPELSNSDYESIVRDQFRSWGMSVSPVETASERRCDCHASDGTSEYLVEIKTRTTDSSFLRDLEPNTVRPLVQSTVSNSKVRSKVSSAVEQLDLTAPNHPSALRLLWWWAQPGMKSDISADQLYGELYGLRHVLAYRKGRAEGDGEHKPALYAAPAKFEHYPQLDGVVLHDEESLQILLNALSSRADQFRASKLARHFQNDNALCDPVERVRSGDWLEVDRHVNRRDESAVKANLIRKYGYELVAIIAMQRYSAVTIVRGLGESGITDRRSRSGAPPSGG